LGDARHGKVIVTFVAGARFGHDVPSRRQCVARPCDLRFVDGGLGSTASAKRWPWTSALPARRFSL